MRLRIAFLALLGTALLGSLLLGPRNRPLPLTPDLPARLLSAQGEAIPFGRRYTYTVHPIRVNQYLTLLTPRIPPGTQVGLLRMRLEPQPISPNRVLSLECQGEPLTSEKVMPGGPEECRFFLGPLHSGESLRLHLGACVDAASAPPAAPSGISVVLDVIDSEVKTADFLAHWDIESLRQRGSDYTNPRYDLHRVTADPEQIDICYDYDFAAVFRLEDRLAGVCRRTALQHLFDHLTRGAQSERERHERVLYFLQQSSFHNLLQPMYPDRSTVTDPLLLLELCERRCGHNARLACDLFLAAGYPARVVQVCNHQTAEVYYAGDWHLCEGECPNGVTPRLADGTIPSVRQLAEQPFLLDQLPSLCEVLAPEPISVHYPSWYFFSREGYRQTGPGQASRLGYYAKPKGPREFWDRYHGWAGLQLEPAEIPLADMPDRFQPGAPQVQAIQVSPASANRRQVAVAWLPSNDGDGDLLGYRVFVASHSRGWCYPCPDPLPQLRPPEARPAPRPQLQPFEAHPGGWRPEMYRHLATVPPSDLALLETSAPAVSFLIPADQTIYFSIMPFDRYGESVKRSVYPMSQEYRIEPRTAPP